MKQKVQLNRFHKQQDQVQLIMMVKKSERMHFTVYWITNKTLKISSKFLQLGRFLVLTNQKETRTEMLFIIKVKILTQKLKFTIQKFLN